MEEIEIQNFQKVMLAIVIPYYKRVFFEKTLQSLANQINKRFNVFIGDDASAEDCQDLITKFEAQINIKYVRFDNNLGATSLTRQWERCIALTDNEPWLMILGDDDVLEANCVETFYKNLDLITTKNLNVIRFACKVIDAQDTVFLGPYFHPELETATDFYCRKAANLTRSSLSEYVFKKSAYQKHGFTNYPLAWYSDDKAWIDFSESKPILTINEAFVLVRFSDVNISGRQDNIEQKLLSAFIFYSDISAPGKSVFTKTQILPLLLRYEQTVKKHRKLKMHEWKMLLRNYIFYFPMIPFLKFSRRLLISFFY